MQWPGREYSPLIGASPYGLLDMAGNVWEWTGSIYNGYPNGYPYDPDDGRESVDDKDPRVVRGGSFHNNQNDVRCAYRLRDDPDNGNLNVGFRVVASPFFSGH